MTDYIALALKYGGFTSLDRVYLAHKLENLTSDQKRDFITPPPSVINAYFAEIYQKQGAKEAVTYYLELCQALELFQEHPTFDEYKPFIRLNLSGRSYGFTFITSDKATVFPENKEVISDALCFEIAQIFPQFVVSVENETILLSSREFILSGEEDITPDSALLTKVFSYRNENIIKLKSLNQDELLELAGKYKGKRYYAFKQREAIIYLLEEGNE